MPQQTLGELFTSVIQTMPTSDDVGKKYEKPVSGIPASDLAETYLTQHQDISGKVDKENGKGLSSNDYTDAEKAKLGNIPAAPVADGNYILKVNVSSGTATYSWVALSDLSGVTF